MLLPTLTLLDEAESASEGSLDPLGLYPVADALGVRLAPGVRQRQRRPRFLTLMCVSAAVCQDFEPDRFAEDGISPPWQVFEWYVVEALIRRVSDGSRLRSLPGRDKVFSAVVQDRVPVSARRYLKTPSVFGFHGVYKTLARALRLVHDGQLQERGVDLLEVWEDERGLRGFWASNKHPWRQKLHDAVAEGLKRGSTGRSATWEGWDFLATHLTHDVPGTKERQVLANALVEGDAGFRRELLDGLVSPAGRQAWSPDLSADERPFHQVLARSASKELREILRAIGAYESLARTLSDAFQECLFELSKAAKPVGPAALAGLSAVQNGARSTSEQFQAAQDALCALGMAHRLATFADLAAPASPAEWVELLMAHHGQVQRSKPPHGKAPWVIRYDDGRYFIRPQHTVAEFQPRPDQYVHEYRARPLTSFAGDLGLIQ